MGKQITFSEYIGRHKTREFTEQDIDQIVAIVCRGCRHKTWQRVRSILTYGPSSIDSYGIFSRLMKDGSEHADWTYVAGQSHVDEIRTLRACILGKG